MLGGTSVENKILKHKSNYSMILYCSLHYVVKKLQSVDLGWKKGKSEVIASVYRLCLVILI